MKAGTIVRIVRGNLASTSLRNHYWNAARLGAEVRALFRPRNKGFRGEVVRSQLGFLFSSPHPIAGETRERARAAVQWILRAQAATPDDGVALGYFPCDAQDEDWAQGDGWRKSYPETTGYIITSLLAYDRAYGDPAAAAAAMRMAAWEIAVQMPSGAVQGGFVCPPEKQTAAAFNTGMVLDGWCSAYLQSPSHELLAAARRAADFLVNDLDENGYFRTNGAFVSAGEIKTYTCLCAWAIHRFGDLTGEERYRCAAVGIIESALRQQQANGWFAHNCLAQSEAPLTHTIGYTLQGVLEVGLASGRTEFVAAVRRSADAILPLISREGFLYGQYFADWEPAVFSSCLTGSSQIAIVLYRLAEATGDGRYRAHADRLVDYLKNHQLLKSDDPNVIGAVAGSYPLLGGYMRAGYPNWATKYFLDALMLQDRAGSMR